MDITRVRTEEQYEQALEEIDQLFNAEEGSPEEERLELLSLLVEDYEDRHYPILPPDPVEAIKFRMEALGLTRKDLAKLIGKRGRVSEILNKRRALTLNMIRKLEKDLDIPAEVLIQKYELESSD